MLAPLDKTTGPEASSSEEPGRAMRVVAGRLAERGLDVHVPEGQEDRFLTICDAGDTRCRVDVEDDMSVLCAYFSPGNEARPGEIAGMVVRMLRARDDVPAGMFARLYRGATMKGAVAREMNARGLKVRLDVIEDHEYYSVTAEVVVRNPARPERGQVRLADDVWVQWECPCPALPGGPAEVADTIAEALACLVGR